MKLERACVEKKEIDFTQERQITQWFFPENSTAEEGGGGVEDHALKIRTRSISWFSCSSI